MAHKNPRMSGVTILLAPGFYELIDSVPNSYTASGSWAAGTRFYVSKHTARIGNQSPYEYLSIRLSGKDKILLSSYQGSKWNIFTTHLARVGKLRVVD